MQEFKDNGNLEIQRLIPTQKRSRERYELILSAAVELIVEKGSESLKMSDIVEKAGIAHGSLYQYFADKYAIIATLAERCNLEGRACVEAELTDVSNQKELHSALLRIVDGYYEMFLHMPLMNEIWKATQSSQLLQKLDSEDVKLLSKLLGKVISKLKPASSESNISVASSLIMHLIAAAVRHAITLSPKDGKQMINAYKSLFPKNISILLAN